MITLNRENIHALFNHGAINSRQRIALGVDYPLKNGWINNLIGKQVSESFYSELLNCKGKKPKGMSKNEWKNIYEIML